MRRLAILAAVLAAALATASAASAKEVRSVVACGRDHHCVSSRDAGVIRAVTDGGPAVVPEHARARSIRLTAIVAHQGEEIARWTSAWVPSERLIVAEDGAWLSVSPGKARALERFTRGLKTFGPGRLHQLPPESVPIGSHAGAPPPIQVDPVRPAAAGAGMDRAVVIGLPAVAVLAGAVLLALRLRRRRPGGSTPEAPAL
jgi:hypothetical protein